MSHDWEGPLRTAVVGAVLLLIVIGIRMNAAEAEKALADAMTDGCRRGNVLRGYVLLRARAAETRDEPYARLAPKLFPIVDCSSRPPLPVQDAVEEQYLEILAGVVPRQPIIENGEIVATKPITLAR